MPSNSNHETISALVDNQLSATERVQAENLVQRDPEARRLRAQFELLGGWVRALPRYRLPADFEQRVLRLIERELLVRRKSAEGAAASLAETLPNRADDREPLSDLVPSRTAWIWGVAAVAASLLVAMWAFPDSLRQRQVALQEPVAGQQQSPAEDFAAAPANSALDSRSLDASSLDSSGIDASSLETESRRLASPSNTAHPGVAQPGAGFGGKPFAAGSGTAATAPAPVTAAAPAAPPSPSPQDRGANQHADGPGSTVPESLANRRPAADSVERGTRQPAPQESIPRLAAQEDAAKEVAENGLAAWSGSPPADVAEAELLLVCRVPNEAALQAAVARFDALLTRQGIAVDLPGEESVDGRLANASRNRAPGNETAKAAGSAPGAKLEQSGQGGSVGRSGQPSVPPTSDAVSRPMPPASAAGAPTNDALQLAGTDKQSPHANALRKSAASAGQPASGQPAANHRVYVIDAQADRLAAALQELTRLGSQGVDGLEIATVSLPTAAAKTTRQSESPDLNKTQGYKSAALPVTQSPGQATAAAKPPAAGTPPTAGNDPSIVGSSPTAPAQAAAQAESPENTARRLELKSLSSPAAGPNQPIETESAATAPATAAAAPTATGSESTDRASERQRVKDAAAPTTSPTEQSGTPKVNSSASRAVLADEVQSARSVPAVEEKRRAADLDRSDAVGDAKGSSQSPPAPQVRLRRAVVVFQIEPAAGNLPPDARTPPMPEPR